MGTCIRVIEQVYCACLCVSIRVRPQLQLCCDEQCMELSDRVCAPCVGEVIRGDSMQSDSSGYADEEVGLTHSR